MFYTYTGRSFCVIVLTTDNYISIHKNLAVDVAHMTLVNET